MPGVQAARLYATARERALALGPSERALIEAYGQGKSDQLMLLESGEGKFFKKRKTFKNRNVFIFYINSRIFLFVFLTESKTLLIQITFFPKVVCPP